MAKNKRKKPKTSVDKQKVMKLDNYRKELGELKEKTLSGYSPKIGRLIKQLNKKIKKVA